MVGIVLHPWDWLVASWGLGAPKSSPHRHMDRPLCVRLVLGAFLDRAQTVAEHTCHQLMVPNTLLKQYALWTHATNNARNTSVNRFCLKQSKLWQMDQEPFNELALLANFAKSCSVMQQCRVEHACELQHMYIHSMTCKQQDVVCKHATSNQFAIYSIAGKTPCPTSVAHVPEALLVFDCCSVALHRL